MTIAPNARRYNAWTKNETLEDYSLRYAPAAFRRWSPWMVFLSCMVGLSAMAGYALDATFVNEFGFGNTLLGFLAATVITRGACGA